MRHHPVLTLCCFLLVFATATAGAAPVLEPGLILVSGGSDINAWFDIYTTSETSYTDVNVYAWGGYTLRSGVNIGPYIGIWWDGSNNDSANSGSTSLTLSPGVQESVYMRVGSNMVFLRLTERLSFWTGSTTSSGDTTSSGFSLQLNAGASLTLTDYLRLEAGPAVYYYMNDEATYTRLEAGVELSLVVLI